jgi:hypothetical protein
LTRKNIAFLREIKEKLGEEREGVEVLARYPPAAKAPKQDRAADTRAK